MQAMQVDFHIQLFDRTTRAPEAIQGASGAIGIGKQKRVHVRDRAHVELRDRIREWVDLIESKWSIPVFMMLIQQTVASCTVNYPRKNVSPRDSPSFTTATFHVLLYYDSTSL